MTLFLKRGGPALVLAATLAWFSGGCNQPAASTVVEAKATTKDKAEVKPEATKPPVSDHSGEWCDEHGMPEAICDLCQKKYRESEKAKGNWCEHNRVKSSCFKCNPGLKEKLAAEYKAKTGKAPPPTEDEAQKEEPKK